MCYLVFTIKQHSQSAHNQHWVQSEKKRLNLKDFYSKIKGLREMKHWFLWFIYCALVPTNHKNMQLWAQFDYALLFGRLTSNIIIFHVPGHLETHTNHLTCWMAWLLINWFTGQPLLMELSLDCCEEIDENFQWKSALRKDSILGEYDQHGDRVMRMFVLKWLGWLNWRLVQLC